MRHLVWGPPASGWTWVMGLAAGGLLYLHMRNLPPPIEFPPEPNIGQGSGRLHLRHEVPPGAPAAVARILQASARAALCHIPGRPCLQGSVPAALGLLCRQLCALILLKCVAGLAGTTVGIPSNSPNCFGLAPTSRSCVSLPKCCVSLSCHPPNLPLEAEHPAFARWSNQSSSCLLPAATIGLGLLPSAWGAGGCR